MLVHQGQSRDRIRNGPQQCLYDFFCQTPGRRRDVSEVDFFPIIADFGADQQEFHIGMGSMAVPGVVAGLFAVHADLCRLPLPEIIQPACRLAREGVQINPRQAYLAQVLREMLRASPDASALYGSGLDTEEFISAGERQTHAQQADALEAIVGEGPGLFYRGQWAAQIAADCAARGGQIGREDLAAYAVRRREPVSFRYRNAHCSINALPSPGGCLVAFGLGMLTQWLDGVSVPWGEPEHLLAVLHSMDAANQARRSLDDDGRLKSTILDQSTLDEWRHSHPHHARFSRGTTHISVADAAGNLASLTVSNGEGCAYIVPGTGIMMNNMLGEQDLNPGGFHRWQPDSRLASMMSPAVVLREDGSGLSLGTGGSNRIRSAMLQVLINLLDFGDTLEQAVARPRIHLEDRKLSLEGGFGAATVAALRHAVEHTHVWRDRNLFFGGVNAVELSATGQFNGASDPRRAGSVIVARS